MKGKRSNIEEIISAYLEGTAGESEAKAAEEYLVQHPEYMAAFEKDLSLKPDPAKEEFALKDLLFKSYSDLDDDQLMMLLAALAEGDLPQTEDAGFNNLLTEAAQRNSDISGFRKLKLKPLNDRFPGRRRLYRTTPFERTVRRSLIFISSAAAVSAIIILTGTLSRTPAADNNNTALINQATISREAVTTPVNKNRQTAYSVSRVIIQKDVIPEIRTTNVNAAEALPAERERAIVLADAISEQPRFENRPGLSPVKQAPVSYEVSTIQNEAPRKENWMVKGISNVASLVAGIRKPETTFDIAHQGITEINKLLGWNMQLQKVSAADGEKSIITFRSDLMGFSKPVKKTR